MRTLDEKHPPQLKTYTTPKTLIVSALLALVAGLLASFVAVIVMIFLRLVAGIPTPVELLGDFYLLHINVHVFIGFLNKFAPNPKTAPLGLALLGMLAVGTVLGLFYAACAYVRIPTRGYRPGRREWLTAAALALAMTLVAVILFREVLAQNLYGMPLSWATIITVIGLLIVFVAYAVTLCLAYRGLLPKQPDLLAAPGKEGRRQLITGAGIAALTVGAGAGTLGMVKAYYDSYTAYDGKETPLHDSRTQQITPNSEFYQVTQNAIDPRPSANLWRLELTGLVGNNGNYTYDELQQLPSTSRAVTMECISNGVGGHLMSTAVWQGVTIANLLAKHGGAQPSATHIAFYSVDGYTTSLPLKEVLAVDPILAWRMNGEVISNEHGYPLRVLMPGRYGEEQPKWLTRIELTDHFVTGLYASQGWYNGPLHTTSRIDYPHGQIAANKEVEVSGIAFAGNRGIQKVEVSTDNAATWQTATLKPALSQDAWVAWTWNWRPTNNGKYTLAVRATDGTGEVQTSVSQRTVPDGGTGLHRVSVQVA